MLRYDCCYMLWLRYAADMPTAARTVCARERSAMRAMLRVRVHALCALPRYAVAMARVRGAYAVMQARRCARYYAALRFTRSACAHAQRQRGAGYYAR